LVPNASRRKQDTHEHRTSHGRTTKKPGLVQRQSAEEVLAQLGSASTGLSAAEVARRLAADGPNELKEGKPISLLHMFLAQFNSLIIWILIAAAVTVRDAASYVSPMCPGAGVQYPFFGLLLSLIIAGAAMSLSSVSVINNALQLRKVNL